MFKNCLICGISFELKHHASKYCSEDCVKVAKSNKSKEFYKLYGRRDRNNKNTSVKNKQSIKFNSKNRTRICKYCNIEFIFTNGNQTHCSPDCSKKTSKENTKRYELKNKEKISIKASEKWLKKNNINHLSEMGIKSNITKAYNKKIKNCSVDCLLEEFGDIE